MARGRILIVDNEPVILTGLMELFGQEYTVFAAPSAEGALALLTRERIDVIVTDYQMQGMDGLALLIEVKRLYPGVSRVLMTAYADMQLVVRAMNEGEINRFISKPFRTFEFRRILEECVALAQIVARRSAVPQGRSILVAHDSMISQAALRLLLTPAYQVLTTANGIEALNLISTRQVDAIVIGVGLELLDGCTIASYLKKEKQAVVPLVFWGSDFSGPYEDYLRECGADLVLDQKHPDSPGRLQKFLHERFA